MVNSKQQKNMRKYLLTILTTFLTSIACAQNFEYVVDSSYEPLSKEAIALQAISEVYHQKVMERRFDEYKGKAYDCYNKGDFRGFIYYSDCALNTGWYSAELYYDRGVAYEELHDYRKAKREYRRALKKGFPAQSAYEQCKINQKEWKKSH